jgi:2-keto-4-pentenoate hydratase/2-oxohepta-3-ene-1,7-dioic acid hydratase in catechol pathway
MKIICVGRNYAKHAAELGNDVPTEPVIFLKPDTALIKAPADFYYPEFTTDLHYECELVVKISRAGKHIKEEFAHKYYQEIGLGVDFTARDLQGKLKKEGLPWELAKGFDNSAVVGKFTPIGQSDVDKPISFSLRKNGQEVQRGSSALMIFSIDRIISFVSQYFTLKVGDLIFTGTPEGVGPVLRGDLLEGFLMEEANFLVKVK